MIVKNILLGRRGVTIEPTADLAAAVKLLAERRIGAVVILGADHRIVGITRHRPRTRRAWVDSAQRTGWSSYDARCEDLLRR